MRKILIALIALLGFAVVGVLFAGTVFATVTEDGYVVPAKAGLAEQIVGDGEPIEMLALHYDDVVYRSAAGYYVGQDRNHIDLNYPMYVNGGAVVRFWGEENWLVTNEVDLYRSFSGQYLSEGTSYNSDMTQADDGEFILITLPNGLYMNAQHAVFSGPLGERTIPVNSVLCMTEEAISWYSYENGILRYYREDAVFGAKIAIGGHVYHYTDLLDALGLIRKAVDQSDGPQVDPNLEQEADEILNGAPNPQGGSQQSRPARPGEEGGSDGDRGNGGDQQSGTRPGEEGPSEGSGQRPGSSGSGGSGSGDASNDSNTGAGDSGSGGGSKDDTGDGKEDGDGGNGSGSGGGSGSDPSAPTEGSGDSGTEGTTPPGEGEGEGDGTETTPDPTIETNPDNTENPDEDFTYPPGEGGGEGDNEGSEGDGSQGGNISYREPKISIQNIQPWSYAIGLDLKITDTAGMLYRGVAFSVYRDVQGMGKTETVTDPVTKKEYTTYSQEDYKGRSKILGRTRYNSESLALSTLDPNSTVYLQYSYRYWQQYTDSEGKVQLRRVRVYSDLYKVTLPGVEEGGVKPLAADWNVAFAASPNAMSLEKLKLENTSAYDPDQERFTFENFKLNTLPYVDHLQFTLTKIEEDGSKGDTKVIKIASSVLRDSQTGKDVSFLSRSPALEPNSRYEYEVAAKDRSGQEIPLQWPQDKNVVYTCKAAPSVEITEVSKTMEALELKVRVLDPDGALKADPNDPQKKQSLRLTMAETKTGTLAYLFGTWDTGKISPGGEDVDTLELIDPSHNAEYTFSLKSLAFARMYTAEVRGDFSTQPQGVSDPVLPPMENQSLGKANFYTESLMSGRVGFTTSYADILDTSVTLNATMNDQTVVEILPLVNAFRLIITDQTGKEVSRLVLDEAVLNQDTYVYEEATATMVLQEAQGYSPRVELYGTKNQVRNVSPSDTEGQFLGNPWQSMCIDSVEDPENPGQMKLTSPMQLKVYMPKGSLTNNTTYTYTLEAVVFKSKEETLIPVTQTGNKFTTKKTIPQILYSDLFLAGDRAEFLDLRIYDPDQTILNNGEVRVYMYYNTDDGSTLLSAQTIYAVQDASQAGIKLEFKDLVDEGSYTLKFVAPSYNDAEGYDSYDKDHLLEAYPIVAGSELKGTITLKGLAPAADQKSYTATFDLDVVDVPGYLGRQGESGQVQLLIERSDSMEDPSYALYKPSEDYENPIVLDLSGNDENDTLALHLKDKMLEQLPVNDSWRLTLKTTYQKREVKLDEITFRSDSGYRIAYSHADLRKYQSEVNPVTGRKDLNILVAQDFTQDINAAPIGDHYGNIDFQGHVVTRGDNITTNCFLRINQGCTVSNLVYDYPRQNNYYNKASIVQDSNVKGTLENIIVRTYGNVFIQDSGYLITSTIPSTGTLRNFIVYAGGDLEIAGGGYRGAVVAGYSNGTVKNGIIYGKNGSGLITRDLPAGGGLFGHMGSSRVSNLYILMDSWHQTGSAGKLYSHPSDRGTTQGMYSVGDFYTINPGDGKHRRTPQTEQYLLRSDAKAGVYDNIWAITGLDYTVGTNPSKFLHMAKTDVLHDPAWQASVLGDGFETKDSVEMGFYPRLKLPACMQKHQEYIYLPAVSASVLPQVVNDSWADEAVYGKNQMDQGHILLRMKNDSNANILGVEIEGLDTNVVDQYVNGAFYEVVLSFTVDHAEADASTTPIGYTSTHNVLSISYALGGGAEQQIPSTYQMKNVELWKRVVTTADWAAINDHMDWNYKLTSDIAFDPEGAGLMGAETINGSTTSWAAKKAFTGKIDGQEHVVSGIRLGNVPNASVIHQTSNAQIRNLFFKDVHISHDPKNVVGYAGIIGLADNSIIENVRADDIVIDGADRVGGIVGFSRYTTIQECSVVNSRIGDVETGKPLYIGGIVGYSQYSTLECSYIRDTRVKVDASTVVSGAGGLAGFGSGGIWDSYAQGILEVEGNYVGGIVGSGAVVDRCWSFVDIRHSGGNYVSGLSGTRDVGSVQNVTLGNISTTATALDRTGAAGSYVYKDQVVTGLTPEEAGVLNSVLLTAEELGQAETWQDVVMLGGKYTYSPVASGNAPLLRADAGRSDWKQIDIPLPGLGSAPSLRIDGASYEKQQYQVIATLEHPYKKHSELVDSIKLDLDGMKIDDAAQEDGEAIVEVKQDANSDEATYISITTTKFEKALDVYTLTVTYNDGRNQELAAVVEYKDIEGNPHHNYWEIASIDDWLEVVPKHGKTSENFRITGDVDFKDINEEYTDLVLNRLEGVSRDTTGFKNLKHQGHGTGTPWIRKVAMGIKDLYFDSMYFDFSYSNAARDMTGAIISCGPVERIKMDRVEIYGSRYNRNYMGFLSNVAGDITDVVMTDCRLVDNNEIGTAGSKCGMLVAYTKNNVSKVTATGLQVYAPYVGYIGGVIGHMENNELAGVDDINITGLRITGASNVGGVGGNLECHSVKNCTVQDSAEGYSHVTGNSNVGGIAGSSSIHRKDCTNLHVKDLEITANKGSAGGASGSTGWFRGQQSSVTGCTIKGTTFVGGFKAGGPAYLYDVLVADCTVTNTAADAAVETSMSTGGLIGNFNGCEGQTPQISGCVVRNTTISGPANVGGAVGSIIRINASDNYRTVYVGTDVTVTATSDSAGGLVGVSDTMYFKNSASGATVTAKKYAGGIVGRVIPRSDALMTKLSNVYFGGKVTATQEYAGGIIGMLNSTSLRFDDETLKGCIVAASVTAPKKISTWVNSTSTTNPPGTGTVYIWEGTTLNGEMVRNLEAVSNVSEKRLYLAPPREVSQEDLTIPDQTFEDAEFYTKILGFDSKFWKVQDFLDKGFMPGIRGHLSSSIPLDPDKDAAILIPLPKGAAASTEVAVYAAGINAVNIELPESTAFPATITIGSETRTVEKQVITIPFTDSITVNSKLYEPLGRRVMTYGANWYFIDADGVIHWGDDSEKKGTVTLGENETALHLWQGKVRTNQGTYYNLNGGEANRIPDPDSDVGPFWTVTSDKGTIENYYYYSTFGGTTMPCRTFYDGSVYRAVTDQQIVHKGQKTPGVVYDGVFVRYDSTAKNSYYALLSNDNQVADLGDAEMELDKLMNANVAQMSNSQNYTGQVLVTWHGRGQVQVVNFVTGNLLANTLESAQQFLSFIAFAWDGLLGELTGDGFYMEDSLHASEALQDQMIGSGVLGAPTGVQGKGSDFASGPAPDKDKLDTVSSFPERENVQGQGDGAPKSEGASGAGTSDASGESQTGQTASGGASQPGGNAQSGAGGGGGNGGSLGTASVQGGASGNGTMTTEEAMRTLFGDGIVMYSQETGRYELLDTQSVASGEPRLAADVLNQREKDQEEAAEPAEEPVKEDDTFQVKLTPGRSLFAAEEQGFLFIAVAAGVAVLGLLLLFLNIINKRRK